MAFDNLPPRARPESLLRDISSRPQDAVARPGSSSYGEEGIDAVLVPTLSGRASALMLRPGSKERAPIARPSLNRRYHPPHRQPSPVTRQFYCGAQPRRIDAMTSSKPYSMVSSGSRPLTVRLA